MATNCRAAESELRAMDSRGKLVSCVSSASSTSPTRRGDVVTRTTWAAASCSAWLSRSAATTRASALSSAITISSLGPAGMSIAAPPCSLATIRFASATHAFPGPQILSTRGIAPAPNASAAIACAPPTVQIASIPEIWAANAITGSRLPSGRGGVTVTISLTPATFAGIASINSVEKRGVLPPGT